MAASITTQKVVVCSAPRVTGSRQTRTNTASLPLARKSAKGVTFARKHASSRQVKARAEEGNSDSKAPEPLYVDDDEEDVKKAQEGMSMEQRKKLRDEYLGLGGSANTAMPNYFLWIIVGISALAVASALTGAI